MGLNLESRRNFLVWQSTSQGQEQVSWTEQVLTQKDVDHLHPPTLPSSVNLAPLLSAHRTTSIPLVTHVTCSTCYIVLLTTVQEEKKSAFSPSFHVS